MRPRRVAILCAAATLIPLAAVPTASATSDQGNGKVFMAFFEQWSIYGRGFSLAQSDHQGQIAKLTDIEYAFGGALPQNGAATDPDPANNPVTCQSLDSWADWQTPYLPDVNGGNPVGDNGLAGNFQQLKELKAKYPGLRVDMSLGGYTGSKFFSDAAATAESRQKFVSSCIDLFIKGNLPGMAPGAAAGIFNGFDLDWEYPGNNNGAPGNHYSTADPHNYTLLAQEFRRQLTKLNSQTHQKYRLTAEVPAGLQNAVDIEAAPMARSLDAEVIMGYDFQGPWAPQGPANFESNLYSNPAAPDTAAEPRISVDATVQYYERHGVPSGQLIVGIPYYGHGWTGVPAGDNNGLFQPATGPAQSPDITSQGTVLPGLDGGDPSGTSDYYEIVNQPGYEWHYDSKSGATWLYNPQTQTFWSMQSPQQAYLKGSYIRNNGLAGASVWALEGDNGDDLTSALSAGMSR